ncbi:LPXTG cell wall anchor domain-containing protein, partial [Lysinibacter cavernae]|uniref:LPXTG cell wall anchor domain-containing protein n=1 Tax=Lysinibacter cavernae TaxID=1640652 RepID=UPI00360F6355
DIKLSPVPGDGKTITVAVTDPAGNESASTSVVVRHALSDAVAPAPSTPEQSPTETPVVAPTTAGAALLAVTGSNLQHALIMAGVPVLLGTFFLIVYTRRRKHSTTLK